MKIHSSRHTSCRHVGRPGLLALCILAALSLFPFSAEAAAPAAKGGNTRIVSEKMTYDSAKQQVIFEGKVHVTRPNMEIWAERLTLVMERTAKAGASSSGGANALGMQTGKVERIVAENNVRIKQENKTGTCGRAVYMVNAGKIVMEQNPVIVEGDNRIKGRVINYFTETGRSEVIGDVDVRISTDEGKGPQLPGVSPASGENAPEREDARESGQAETKAAQ